ncbi:putative Spindle pole body formation-associated protein-domain-containing protein [Seiridium cardinale]|uniref:Spindle pole body formation-associated protein-domain-containing protein n=1 Tax=Seiridium cardinale TaxID=138064 RepID=A0ABR2X620_9PEZI
MLGWALKRGIQGATGARDAPLEEGDTTQIEVPDTPAPVFAARAIKHAIFGTPAPSKETLPRPQGESTENKSDDAFQGDSRSPTKPTGILLTPGTATARRKRVSFDHDVKAGTNGEPGAFVTKTTGAGTRKKSVQQRLEESRSNKPKKNGDEVGNEDKLDSTATAQAGTAEEETDEEWEDDVCSHDVTVDLNEPHSRSGKYWKSEFNKYSGDARAEMEKLVKYKHLAKCYAQKKDAEAVDLNQQLKEEREKVAELEKKFAKLASGMTKSQRAASDIEDAAMATQYKSRIKELEALIHDQEDLGGKSQHHRIDASPRTEKTLLETSRELRRARHELKEMKKLQKENERLKSDLVLAEQKATKLEGEKKPMSADLSQPSWIQKLEKQLRDSKEEAERKDCELKALRHEFDNLKENAKSSRSQALQVLKEKNDRIAELEKEVKAIKESDGPKNIDAALARHSRIARDLKSEIASMSKPSIHEKAQLGRPKRSMSAEDLTLDLTQNSLLGNSGHGVGTHGFSADLTDSLRNIEETLRRERQERMEARKRDRGLATVDLDARVSKNSGKDNKAMSSQPSFHSRRVMSDRVNEASAKNTKNQIGSHATRGPNEGALMRGALDNLTKSRHTKSRAVRPPSPAFDMPGFDLLQNRFAKLGGPNPNDTVLTANASRCTLPADRQAAARARIEQKRRERQKGTDKENSLPSIPKYCPLRYLTNYEITKVNECRNMKVAVGDDSRGAIESEIAELEARLLEAKQRLATQPELTLTHRISPSTTLARTVNTDSSSAHHYLLLLSDSALPLGSFAFSSGLESYKTHTGSSAAFNTFLPLSLSSYASTTLPFVLAAHRDPSVVAELDDAYDAAVICTVGRRASVAQGRALLGVWEKSFAPAVPGSSREVISSLKSMMSPSSSSTSDLPPYSAHLAPLFGAICNLLGLTLHQAAYVFMLSHVKALVSAGVRAAMMGPYVAQRILASGEVQDLITAMIDREWETKFEEAGQSVPVMDLWIGRHEMLYSRIFNS